MLNEIKLYLGDWRTNASIIGLLNILDNFKKGQYEIIKEGYDEYVKVPISSLKNFEQKYFKYFIDVYTESIPWYKIVSYKDDVNRFLNNIEIFQENDLKKLNIQIELVKDYLRRNNYKKVFKFVESNIDIEETVSEIKKVNLKKKEEISDKTEEITKALELMKKIIDYCSTESGKKYLGAKGVIYGFIDRGINNVSFLNRGTKEYDVYEDYRKYFIVPLLEYLDEDKEKYKYNCFNCNNKIKDLNTGISMVNETGFDVSRKTSNVWFEENDVGICVVCKFLYSCLPAGINYAMNEGIFVNANTSLKELLRVNRKIAHELEEKTNTKGMTYRALVNSVSDMNIDNLKYQLEDVQVIRQKNDRYVFNILSKKSLKIINDCRKELNQIVSAGYQIGRNMSDYVSIYDEVVSSLFNNRNLYLLIYKLINYKLTKTSLITAYYTYNQILSVIKINASLLKEVITLENKSIYEYLKKYNSYGYHLAKKYKEVDDNYENKIRGISYRMINAIKVNDKKAFMHNLVNSYMYVKESMPGDIIKVLASDDDFMNIGYAFVVGLNSYGVNKDNSNNKNTNKGEK